MKTTLPEPAWELLTTLYKIYVPYQSPGSDPRVEIGELPITKITNQTVFFMVDSRERRIEKRLVDTSPHPIYATNGTYFTSKKRALRVWWHHWTKKLKIAQDTLRALQNKATLEEIALHEK